MTASVDRLQGLLNAVQRNRRAQRGPSAAPPAPAAPIESAALDPEILGNFLRNHRPMCPCFMSQRARCWCGRMMAPVSCSALRARFKP